MNSEQLHSNDNLDIFDRLILGRQYKNGIFSRDKDNWDNVVLTTLHNLYQKDYNTGSRFQNIRHGQLVSIAERYLPPIYNTCVSSYTYAMSTKEFISFTNRVLSFYTGMAYDDDVMYNDTVLDEPFIAFDPNSMFTSPPDEFSHHHLIFDSFELHSFFRGVPMDVFEKLLDAFKKTNCYRELNNRSLNILTMQDYLLAWIVGHYLYSSSDAINESDTYSFVKDVYDFMSENLTRRFGPLGFTYEEFDTNKKRIASALYAIVLKSFLINIIPTLITFFHVDMTRQNASQEEEEEDRTHRTGPLQSTLYNNTFDAQMQRPTRNILDSTRESTVRPVIEPGHVYRIPGRNEPVREINGQEVRIEPSTSGSFVNERDLWNELFSEPAIENDSQQQNRYTTWTAARGDLSDDDLEEDTTIDLSEEFHVYDEEGHKWFAVDNLLNFSKISKDSIVTVNLKNGDVFIYQRETHTLERLRGSLWNKFWRQYWPWPSQVDFLN